MSKVAAILDLLGRGVADHHVASRTGVTESYVRAVRSRYTAPDVETFLRRAKNARTSMLRTSFTPGVRLPARPRKQRSGQSREELRALAETLYRWRTEGREAR